MPLEQVKKGEEVCWRWGSSGKVYCGSDAKRQAIKQGLAIDGPSQVKKMLTKSSDVSDIELLGAIREYQQEHQRAQGSYHRFHDTAEQSIDWTAAYVSQKEREKMPESDFAWPEEKKYPIQNQAHLDAAVKLLGRAPADKQEAIKRRIIEIAHRKGLKLPDSWNTKK